MEIKFYGTRGSVPVSNRASVEVGGNTTCLQIKSQCLPPNMALVVDAGSGFVPFCAEALREGVKNVHILFTHYHHDHTQGLPLGPITFIKKIPITCWGPVDGTSMGPKEILGTLMKQPFFPVHFTVVGSHFDYRRLQHPNTQVILIHPQGGVKQMTVEAFERLEAEDKLFPVGKGKYPKSECLVIRMLHSNHPERTISYRFEEGPTKKVFVFLTDHENMDGLPKDLGLHLKATDLLVMDSQYSRKKYDAMTAGFGHGTPGYCVKTALQVGAKKLGLTHHDPASTDEMVEQILVEGQQTLEETAASLKKDVGFEELPLGKDDIFICRDYAIVDV